VAPPAGVYPDAGLVRPPPPGLGLRATANTGSPLADAFPWLTVPGANRTCTRGAPAGSVDPAWGTGDPAAGEWFPQRALSLAQLANRELC
jgi:endoglucanase